MKNTQRKFLLALIALLFTFSVSSSTVFAGLGYVPTPNAPLNYGNKYQTDIFTGSGAYSYPIKVPKGTNDLTPEVALSYNSAAAYSFSSSMGSGWELSRDYIERDVNFTPGNTSDDKFKLHFKGAVHELIYVSSEGRYHTKTESFLHIKKLTGGSNSQSDYWEVITQDGTKYRFGYQSQSELLCAGRNYITLWNLDQVEDIHNNKMYYSYTEGVGGTSYLTKIEYNNALQHVIEFAYAGIPTLRYQYIQGCDSSEPYRLYYITVKTNNTLVRQYDVAFSIGENGQSLLDSVTEKGNNGTALPPTTFAYKSEINGWNTTPETWINNANIDTYLERSDTAMADVNGDGFLDIVRTDHNGGPNVTWKVLFNQGGTSWPSTFQVLINNVAMEDARLNRTDVRLMDVTGDNLPDIVMAAGADYWRVWRNTGGNWNTSNEVWANLSSISGDIKLSDNRTRLADVTGDGRPDIVRTWWNNSGMEWQVFRNTGSSWSTSPEIWISTTSVTFGLDDPNVALVDANGDGTADIVRSTYTGDNSNSWDTWKIYKSTGSSFISGGETWINNANITAHISMENVGIADVNGDRLPDIAIVIDGGPNDLWAVLINKGQYWSTTWQTWVPTSAGLDIDLAGEDSIRIADANGDGLADLVHAGHSGSNVTWKVYKNKGNAPKMLSSVQTPQGGVINFDYLPSTKFDNTGADSLSDLPFPMWVVEKMTATNGLSNAHGTSDITTYSYKDGLYKWQDKEFRGFNEINTTEPNGSKKKYVFHQSDTLKGKPDEVQTRDNASNPYLETEYVWSTPQSNGITANYLDSEKNYTYDGTASNPKIVQTDFQYDNYGNITKKSEKGDTSITTDDRFIYNVYTYNTSSWLVDTLRNTYTKAADDATKIAEKWLYYDNHTWVDDAPTKGDLTKEVTWLDGGTNPIKLFTYDTYGNLTQETDANNNTTTYAYDSATHTYPISTTNAKNQTTTTSYDLGTGNLLSKTDPNNQTTTYEYDVFGRITKEIKPYDSSTYPTVKYQYFTDGVDGTLVSKRETSGTADVLNTYTWVDGLGRKIQTRTDAEDPSKQSIVNTFYGTTGQVSKETVPHEGNSIDYYADPLTGILSTQTSYDAASRVSIITNPKGDTKTVSYDHWKETVIDENGHIKREFKNAFDKIVKVEEVNAGNTYTTTYTYNHKDQLTKITDNASNEISFTYDTMGRKTSQVDPDMGTWTYEYDAAGNLTSQTDARNVEITKTYDELNRITKTDYPTDTDTTYLYDAYGRIGTLSIATDSAGMATYLYDDRLRKTEEQRKVDGTTKATKFTYDSADRTKTQVNPDNETITYAFNPQGEIESVTGSSNIVTNINYNALGKITQKSFTNGLSTTYTYNTNDFRLNRIQTDSVQDMSYTYDNVGNITSITDNLQTKTQNFTYDDLDRLKTASESAGYNYAYQYNSIGNLTKFTNAGAETDYSYGGNGKPHAMTSSTETVAPPAPIYPGNPPASSIKDNWSSGSINTAKWINWGGSQISVVNGQLQMNSTLSSGYYGVDTGNSVKPYNLTDSYVSNELVSAGNQSLSTWEVYPIYMYSGTTANQYFFYLSGNTLRAYKKVAGVNTILATATYNATNHRWFRIVEAGGDTYFDTSADGQSWDSFASTPNAFAVTDMVVGAEVGTWSTEASTTSAIFDNFNYAALPTASLTDNWTSGDINSVRWIDWSEGQAEVQNGQLRMESNTDGGYYGVDTGNDLAFYDLTESYVVNQLVDAGNQNLTSWEVYPLYAYVTGDSSTQYFWYISEGTLRAYVRVDGVNTELASTSYNSTNHKWFRLRETGGVTYFDYSANGQTWTNFASTSNAFDITSLIIGMEIGTWDTESTSTTAIFDNFNAWNPTYTYDANGNLTSDGFKCYEFNEANQMKKVKSCDTNQTIAEYIYDFKGDRMVKKNYANGTLKDTITSWSDSYETKVINGGGTENTAYYFANGQLLAKKDNNGIRTFFHNDHLGSTNIITNQYGGVIEKTTYDPWGEIKSGGTKSKFQYTGQEKDDETGLHYYNARYYDPHTRHFTQPDDIIQDPYDPQMINRYAYVRNNPLRYTDPTGHCIGPFLAVCVIGAVAAPHIIANINPIIAQVSQIYNSIRKDSSPKNVVVTVGGAALDIAPGGKAAKTAAAGAKNITNKLPDAKNTVHNSTKETNNTSSNFRQNLGKITSGVQKGYDAHHVFPQKFRSTFESAGLKIDNPKYGAWWEASEHRKNAYQYNKEWNNYLTEQEKSGTLSEEGILNFGNQLMGSYGLRVNY